jgi:hypothetical protein
MAGKRKSKAGAGGEGKRRRRGANGAAALSSAQSSRSTRLASLTKRDLLDYADFLKLDLSMEVTAKVMADTVVRHEASSDGEAPSTTDIKAGTFRKAPVKGRRPSESGKRRGRQVRFEPENDDEDIYKPFTSCNHCDADVSGDSAFCGECGKSPTSTAGEDVDPTTWTCNACDTDGNSAHFCGECGGARVHTCSMCNASVEGKFCGKCGTARASKSQPQRTKPGTPSLPGSLLGLGAEAPFPTTSLFSFDPAERERYSRCSKVQHTLLFTTPRNVRAALAAQRYVPLQQARPRTLVRAHGDAFSKRGSLSIGESGSLSVATGVVKQSEISSEADMLMCLRNLHRLEALLTPAKSPTNLDDYDMITRLLKACPWGAVYTFVEEARIANDGTIDPIGEPAGVQLTDLLTRRGSTGSTSSKPGPAASTPRGTGKSANLKVKKDKQRIPQALADETISKSLCLAFQKGTCKEKSDHEITKKRDTTKIKVAHRCVICDAVAHGALACPERE